MRMVGEIKLKRNERACDEGCFTLGDLMQLLRYDEHMRATIRVCGADCRYIRVERKRGEVTVVFDERHPDA